MQSFTTEIFSFFSVCHIFQGKKKVLGDLSTQLILQTHYSILSDHSMVMQFNRLNNND